MNVCKYKNKLVLSISIIRITQTLDKNRHQWGKIKNRRQVCAYICTVCVSCDNIALEIKVTEKQFLFSEKVKMSWTDVCNVFILTAVH